MSDITKCKPNKSRKWAHKSCPSEYISSIFIKWHVVGAKSHTCLNAEYKCVVSVRNKHIQPELLKNKFHFACGCSFCLLFTVHMCILQFLVALQDYCLKVRDISNRSRNLCRTEVHICVRCWNSLSDSASVPLLKCWFNFRHHPSFPFQVVLYILLWNSPPICTFSDIREIISLKYWDYE